MRAVRNRCINYLNSEWEKREIAFSSLMPDEITDDKMTISDSHPLGDSSFLIEGSLKMTFFRFYPKKNKSRVIRYLLRFVCKDANAFFI